MMKNMTVYDIIILKLYYVIVIILATEHLILIIE